MLLVIISDIGTYHSGVYDITKPSAKYTGSWIKNVTTADGKDGISQFI